MKSVKKSTSEKELPEANSKVAEAAETAVENAVKNTETAAETHNAEVVQSTETNETETAQAQPVVYGDKVLTPSQKKKRMVLRWVLLLIGITMMSCSVYFFQKPNDFTLGGIAGIAMILSSFITEHVSFLTYDVIMAIINVALLIIGLIILGKQCTIRTIICSLFYTGFITLFEHFDVIGHISETGRLTNDPLLELVYAILLFGVGGALVFNCGASSGGTDIIALILKKFTNINVGMALMIIDMIVVCISFYTFSVECALFSVLGLFTKSFLLDGVIESIGKTKYITIITENPDIIAEYILKVIKHGYTVYDAEGGYSHNKKKVIVTVCNRNEALTLKVKIHEADPTSFVII
ncbi:MAG: YitT family protein, partial [Clostridia bacterium]|nr:YitT family protein [Clostridia bacterium]